MNGKITITLVSERQDGHIGDDWKYRVDAKTFNDGLVDEGSLNVAEHILPDGSDQEPPGPPAPLVLDAGAAGSDVLVRLHVDATEVDALVDDHGANSRDVTIACPGPGEPPGTQEETISVGVMESPVIEGESAVLKLTFRLSAES